MFSSKTIQLFLSITAFAAISSPTSVLAAPLPRQSKSSKKRKSSKSAPPLPLDLQMCEGLGDPVYTPPAAPQPVLPSSLVRTYPIVSFGGSPPPFSGGEIKILDTTGIVHIKSGPCGAYGPNSAYPADALWCNAEGQQQFRITAYTSCLHSSTDDYYYIKYVKTQPAGTSGAWSNAGQCVLLRVSREAPGTWTEYRTPETTNGTAGAAIEWAYDVEPVGLRYKFSLCPNPEDQDIVEYLVATFD